jgi:uncharacterized protein (UPF0332 family)
MSEKLIAEYWLEKSIEDLASAHDNLSAGRLQNSVRDAYFACFHAFSAVLFKKKTIGQQIYMTKWRKNLNG